MENVEKQVKDGASWAANKSSEYLKDFGDKAQIKANEYSEKIRNAGDRVASASMPDMEDAKRLYEEGKSHAYDLANSFGRNLTSRVRENPILTSVASLAVGFGIATWLFTKRTRS